MTTRTTGSEPSVAIVGAGSLASFLGVALHEAGFKIAEIIVRGSAASRKRARSLALKVGAKVATADSASLDASLMWLCVPDREIRRAALSLAGRVGGRKIRGKKQKVRFAFHSSGALLSRELEPLRKAGVAVASVHPLMTFVAGAKPSLAGVPFAIEGDAAAARVARRIVRILGGESFALPPARKGADVKAAGAKAAYHAWATLTSPLLLAFLVTLEEAARGAGITARDARRRSLPIIMQTIANYSRLGSARSFSGPLIRGDAETVAKHLAVLKSNPGVREVYVALARAALRGLPVKNRNRLKQVLGD
jgi:predicted short-subunit dehydrogenase-like oxidoreductase (DUF2520 family)